VDLTAAQIGAEIGNPQTLEVLRHQKMIQKIGHIKQLLTRKVSSKDGNNPLEILCATCLSVARDRRSAFVTFEAGVSMHARREALSLHSPISYFGSLWLTLPCPIREV
jgi:hypothetical protein